MILFFKLLIILLVRYYLDEIVNIKSNNLKIGNDFSFKFIYCDECNNY